MNFIKGTIGDLDGFYFLPESGICRIFLGSVLPSTVHDFIGKPVQLGLRPENIIICEGSDDQDKPDCSLQVSAYENMGNEQLVYLSFAKQTLIARRPPLESIEVGKEKGIRFMTKKAFSWTILAGTSFRRTYNWYSNYFLKFLNFSPESHQNSFFC